MEGHLKKNFNGVHCMRPETGRGSQISRNAGASVSSTSSTHAVLKHSMLKSHTANFSTVECHLSGHHLSEHVEYPTVGSIK